LGGTTVTFTIWTDDVEGMFERAVSAGATVDSPPADAYWGARYARITDPSGHGWILSTHLEDVSVAEQQRRAEQELAETHTSTGRDTMTDSHDRRGEGP
jgi:PhnB protein